VTEPRPTPLTVPPPYRHLVAAIDDTEHARLVAARARELADQIGARLHVFHADLGIHDVDPAVRRSVEELASEFGAEASVVPLSAAPGRPAQLIADEVASRTGSIAALGSRGRHGLAAVILGSTTADYLRNSGRPAIVFGHAAGSAGYTRIVRVACGLDGSRWAEEMLPEAAGWAAALRVPLWLVRAAEGAPALAGPAGADDWQGSEDDLDDGDAVDSPDARYLRDQAARLAAAGVQSTPQVVRDHHPGAALVGWLNAEPGTMTVVATHGRTGLAAVELGGTAGAVVRNATGPVLLRRPDRVRPAHSGAG
jgi:nucleotide-binding universal stress UspA family protein